MLPEPTEAEVRVGFELRAKARTGWYLGDIDTLDRFGARQVLPAKTNPNELMISLLLSRDRMHHSVGWWRNAEYEYCWHLSMCAWDKADYDHQMTREENRLPFHEPKRVDIPKDELKFWALIVFGGHIDKLWHEPGGTDPRLSLQERIDRRNFVHLRMFLNPLTGGPFIPKGEVYHLTHWIPGLTPEKVDR